MQFLSDDKYSDILTDYIVLDVDFENNEIKKFDKLTSGEFAVIFYKDYNQINLLRKIDNMKFFAVTYTLKEQTRDKYFTLIRERIERYSTKLKIVDGQNYVTTLDDTYWKILKSDNVFCDVAEFKIEYQIANYDDIEGMLTPETIYKKIHESEVQEIVDKIQAGTTKFYQNLSNYIFNN